MWGCDYQVTKHKCQILTITLQRCPLKSSMFEKNNEKLLKWLLCLKHCNYLNTEMVTTVQNFLISLSGKFYYFDNQYWGVCQIVTQSLFMYVSEKHLFSDHSDSNGIMLGTMKRRTQSILLWHLSVSFPVKPADCCQVVSEHHRSSQGSVYPPEHSLIIFPLKIKLESLATICVVSYNPVFVWDGLVALILGYMDLKILWREKKVT